MRSIPIPMDPGAGNCQQKPPYICVAEHTRNINVAKKSRCIVNVLTDPVKRLAAGEASRNLATLILKKISQKRAGELETVITKCAARERAASVTPKRVVGACCVLGPLRP